MNKKKFFLCFIGIVFMAFAVNATPQPELQTVKFNPPGGSYRSKRVVRLSAKMADADIIYTTDGSLPSRSNGIIYSEPVPVYRSLTFRAVALKKSWKLSEDVISQVYEIAGTVAAPILRTSSTNGKYFQGQKVILSTTTPRAQIRYTTDRTTPTRTHGVLYSAPIKLSSFITTIKAVAYTQEGEESPVHSDDFTFEYYWKGGIMYRYDKGEITVFSSNRSIKGAYDIPGEIDGYPVTAIAQNAFNGCSSLTGITLPQGLTSIGHGAFEDSGLISITIPDGITSIGYGAFSGCLRLTGITLPQSLTSIGGEAFSGCVRLTGITLPEGITSIGSGAFSGCVRLTGITLPKGITSIQYHTFYGCYGLTSITFPKDLNSIEIRAFYGCTRLTEITLPAGVTSIGNEAFKGCKGLTDITFSQKLKTIKRRAFYGCTSLTRLTFPKSLSSIIDNAFAGCTNLTDIYMHPLWPPRIYYQAFPGNTKATLHIHPDARGYDHRNWSNFTIVKDL